MEDPLQKILRDYIPLQDQEGQSKEMPLSKALERFVEPGMTIHTGMAPIPPNAAMFEVDRFGNINSTMVPPNFLITGSGGSNDVAALSEKVLAVVPLSPHRFLKRVPLRRRRAAA